MSLLGRNAGDGFHILRGIFFHDGFEGLKPFGALFDKRLVVQVFLDDDVHHAVDPGHVGTQVGPEPVLGKFGHLDPSRIHHDELGPPSGHGPFDKGRRGPDGFPWCWIR